MEEKDQHEGPSSISWQFTRGMIVSQVALTTVLIKAGVITLTDAIAELNRYIALYEEKIRPDGCEEIMAPVKHTRDMLEAVFTDTEKHGPQVAWISDLVGSA